MQNSHRVLAAHTAVCLPAGPALSEAVRTSQASAASRDNQKPASKKNSHWLYLAAVVYL